MIASTVIMKSNIRAFVKLNLFHLVKFWDKDIYGEKSYKTNTVCGWFAKIHHIEKSKDFIWWDRGVSKEMGRMHTDHRNNCIKAIKKVYQGMNITRVIENECLYFSHTMDGNKEEFTNAKGRDIFADGEKAAYLKMQSNGNAAVYAAFLDKFTPCVVGKTKWKMAKAHIQLVVNKRENLDSFFSVTDESFLLLVMKNYRARWMWEFQKKRKNKNEDQEN